MLLSIWSDTSMLSPCTLKYFAHVMCHGPAMINFINRTEIEIFVISAHERFLHDVYAEQQLVYASIVPYFSFPFNIQRLVQKYIFFLFSTPMLSCWQPLQPFFSLLYLFHQMGEAMSLDGGMPSISTSVWVDMSLDGQGVSLLLAHSRYCAQTACLWMEATLSTCAAVLIVWTDSIMALDGRNAAHLRSTDSVNTHVSGWRHDVHLHIPWAPER